MADQENLLDRAQVKKAVQALQAFLKSRSTKKSLFRDEPQKISLLFTLWKIPKVPQKIRIPLPHAWRSDTEEVCLFTRDEPNMSAEQTQRFYKKLLEVKGVKSISEIIPYNMLKKEYKPFEAKRRLLGNFDMFLSDDRIRRLLPSHIGSEFYKRKREPLCVDLQSKHLARDVQRLVQGSRLSITNKGCCCMTHVAHSGMTADEATENIEAAVQAVVQKMRMKGPVIKVIHLKSLSSVALPIYTSDLKNLAVLDAMKQKPSPAKNQKRMMMMMKNKKKPAAKTTVKKQPGQKLKAKAEQKKKTTKKKAEKKKNEEDEEEIPQLVPIETPSKKPKLEKTAKKAKKQVRPAAAKPAGPRSKKAGKAEAARVKRKTPRGK